MKFLVDAHLPRRLVSALVDRGHDALHTLDLPDRNRTADRDIIEIADRDDRIVISKDSDFRDSHLRRGEPRQLLWVTTGNIANRELLELFDRHLDLIEAAAARADFLELAATRLVVHGRRTP